MAKKEFTYKGRSFEELKDMGIKELATLLPSRQRRSLVRGFTEPQKRFLKRLNAPKEFVETHCRDMIILPSMVGRLIKVHNGKDFIPVNVEKDMIGHYLGEFVSTRKKVAHSAPGIGATKSSASLSVK